MTSPHNPADTGTHPGTEQTPAEQTLAGQAPTAAGDREGQVSRAFVSLADTLVDDYDIIELLDRLVAHCVELLAADAAAIMLLDPSDVLRAVASSSEAADLMELLQLEAQQGPCVQCVDTGAPVSVADLTDPSAVERWPRFVDALTQHRSYRSVHAIPLRLRGQAIGALNLFHREPGPLPSADLALAQALADVATIGILSERAIHGGEVLAEQLQTALNSRVIIEQAKGVIAAKGAISPDAAFHRLCRYARTHDQRLVEVARRVAQTSLPASDVLTAQTDPSPTTGQHSSTTPG